MKTTNFPPVANRKLHEHHNCTDFYWESLLMYKTVFNEG